MLGPGSIMRRRTRERDDDAERLYAGIARQIAAHRARRRLSQQDVADLCGTTQSAIARLEAGARPPRIDTLLRVANALDCELRIELRTRTTIEGGSR
jgi:transcriptional regulator with XRE-family HTH domain